MTIDEAINRLEQLKREIYTKSLFVGYYDDAIQVAINSINELQWYREQDLILRTDAIFCSKEDLYEAYEKTINTLPKAEPTFATDTNVGDKEK